MLKNRKLQTNLKYEHDTKIIVKVLADRIEQYIKRIIHSSRRIYQRNARMSSYISLDRKIT